MTGNLSRLFELILEMHLWYNDFRCPMQINIGLSIDRLKKLFKTRLPEDALCKCTYKCTYTGLAVGP